MNELISIIVPIYNVEDYLRECLDSIQKQTYPNFECIMVNDGSTDNSKQIAEEYLVDSRFRLINQSNQGLSGARNTGISHIREESTFVAFVDSDDYVYPNFLETLVEYIEEDVDIIEGMVEHYHNGNIYYFPQVEHYKVILETVAEKLEKLALERIRNGIFPKLIRRELLNDNFFPEGWLFEDLAVVPELVTNSTKWVKIQETVYTYRIRDNSIITSSFSEKDLVIFKIFEKFDCFFKNESLDIKIWVEKLKLLHINYRIQKVPNQYIYIYQKEKERILSNIEEYEKGELISIIVPIYNVENYLQQCLDSIRNQTYQNFECLLINDGSPDNSADICREYVEKDSRFQYFVKENGGLSDARNYGIRQSKGSYLTFVDSDDWIDSSYLETLYELIIKHNADVSVACYGAYDEERATYLFYAYGEEYEKVYSEREVVEQLPKFEGGDLTFQTSWGILSKRELFDQITFPVGRINEDIGTNYKLFMQAKKIAYIHKNLYIYRIRKTSISNSGFSEKMMRDDHDLRLERIAMVALKGYDISHYIQQHRFYLDYWHRVAEEQGLGNSIETKRLEELDYLLTGKIYEEK